MNSAHFSSLDSVYLSARLSAVRPEIQRTSARWPAHHAYKRTNRYTNELDPLPLDCLGALNPMQYSVSNMIVKLFTFKHGTRKHARIALQLPPCHSLTRRQINHELQKEEEIRARSRPATTSLMLLSSRSDGSCINPSSLCDLPYPTISAALPLRG